MERGLKMSGCAHLPEVEEQRRRKIAAELAGKPHPWQRVKELTPGDVRTIQMTADSKSYREIAKAFRITMHGIDRRVNRIYNRLQISKRTRIELMRVAIRKGLITA